MSDKERSEEGGSDESFLHREDDDPRKRQQRASSKRKMRQAKHAVLFPFRKVKRLYTNKTSTSPSSSASSSSAVAKANRPGKTTITTCSYLCYMKPLTSDSPAASSTSQTSDPNSPAFSYEFCKSLIEKNDFFSKECNVHLDISHTD